MKPHCLHVQFLSVTAGPPFGLQPMAACVGVRCCWCGKRDSLFDDGGPHAEESVPHGEFAPIEGGAIGGAEPDAIRQDCPRRAS